MKKCDYGCNRDANFKMKNGKWCCNKTYQSCPEIKRKNRVANVGLKRSPEDIKRNSDAHKGVKFTEEHKANMRGPRPSMLGNDNRWKHRR